MLTPDRKGPYWEMWKLEVCFCLQLAAGLQRCCNPFMHQYWLQCCKCSKKWIDQEGPGSHTGYPGSKASTVAMREAQPSSAGSVLLR